MRNCKHLGKRTEKKFPQYGLGDYLENSLQKLGITKERWQRFTSGCGCNKRQKLLNEVGAKFGAAEGLDPDLKKRLDTLSIKNLPVYQCPIKEQCINIRVDDEDVAESLTITACGNCEAFE